ncbi:MAG: hypothetical protein OEQ39_00110 [Gammaproteobacteria bacterium]|nr:hypothetical protein [Gammaproteobacteria bacterium]
MSLITLAEANAALPQELFPDWEAATSFVKQKALDNMSGFISNRWYDPDAVINWEDPVTIPAAVKDILAKYADADVRSQLYPTSTAGTESQAPIKRITQKAGSLEITKEYAQPDVAKSDYSLRPLDEQMIFQGLRKLRATGTLRRV